MNKSNSAAFTIYNSNEIVEALVGLKDVRVISYNRVEREVFLLIDQVVTNPRCPSCGDRANIHDRPIVSYIDLPVFATPMKLKWKKHRLRCDNDNCSTKTWTLLDHRIAAKGVLLTTRAAKWATRQVGGGRTIKEVADELSCYWHTICDAVTTYGNALIEADHRRLNKTNAIGLDETSFVRLDKGQMSYATTICDVSNHQIIDILPTRNYQDVAKWIMDHSLTWRNNITYGALDLSATYNAVYKVTLPKALRVADPFHVVALANRALDQTRRRVQNETTSHRGRRDDPLYRARRILLAAEENLSTTASEKLATFLALGDPNAEVAITYSFKEAIRRYYQVDSHEEAKEVLYELIDQAKRKHMPYEVQRLGRTIERWFEQIHNYHIAKVSNGPTEAINNLIKRVKRVGFGFRNFDNYRIRVLLYCGKPNWKVLDSMVVR